MPAQGYLSQHDDASRARKQVAEIGATLLHRITQRPVGHAKMLESLPAAFVTPEKVCIA